MRSRLQERRQELHREQSRLVGPLTENLSLLHLEQHVTSHNEV
jgi:hypothetical protein